MAEPEPSVLTGVCVCVRARLHALWGPQNGSFAVDFGGVRLRSAVPLAPNTWYHVAVTKRFSLWKLETTVLYVDGVAVPLSVRVL